MLAFIAPVHAQEFGHAFLDGAASGGLSGDYKRGSRFALTEPGVLNMMKAFLDGQGGPQTGYQNVSMVLYQDANGVPGVKLWESAPTKIQAQSGAQWYEFDTNPVALPAGSYWLVIHSGGTADGSTPGIARDYWSPRDGNNWYGNADTFADGASSPFGTGGAGTGELLVFGHYLPARLARFAGRASVAATPSGGLSSHFKRGSRFTMTEPGRVFELSASVDGKGGGTGSQKLRYVLYRDSGGVPGAKIVESDEVTIKAGQSAGWISAHVVMNDLQPGNYWIMIQSGDTAGIARDYGDNIANWWGFADSFADGGTDSFDPYNDPNVKTGTVELSLKLDFIVPGT